MHMFDHKHHSRTIAYDLLYFLFVTEGKRSVRPVRPHVVRALAQKMLKSPESGAHVAPWIVNVNIEGVDNHTFNVDRLKDHVLEVLGGNNSSVVL